MELLKKREIKVYRTDESGSMIMKTDGKNIEFDKAVGDYLAGSELY